MNPKPDKLIPALYGGVIMGLISAIPFLNFLNCFCCAGILLGGILAVMFYKNNFTPDTPPFTSGDCMAVGALAGVAGAVVNVFLTIAFLALFGNITQQFLLDFLHSMNLQLPDEAWRAIEEGLTEDKTGFALAMNFVVGLFIDSIFGLLGGLIGYSIFKPKQTPMPPMPQPPPAPLVTG